MLRDEVIQTVNLNWQLNLRKRSVLLVIDVVVSLNYVVKAPITVWFAYHGLFEEGICSQPHFPVRGTHFRR